MLHLQQFFVKERTGMLKTSNAYDILDPSTQKPIGVAQEKPSMLMKILFKDKAGTSVEMRDTKEKLIFTIQKPFKLFGRPKIKVVDSANKELGYFVSKMFSIGGGFHLYSADGKHIAEVKGNWKSKEFQMLTPGGKELGTCRRNSRAWPRNSSHRRTLCGLRQRRCRRRRDQDAPPCGSTDNRHGF